MHNRSEEQLRNAIMSYIPKEFFQDILSDLQISHKEACFEVEKKYSHPVARDVLPHIRRANFEEKMPSTARKHKLNANSALNKTKNAAHTEIEAPIGLTKLVLTALYAPNRFDLTKVKSAQFRKTLAEIQPWLFDEYKNIGDAYYGLILYSASVENKEKLDFAFLAFPSSDCKSWFCRYSLYELAGLTSNQEIIEDNASPKLKKDLIRKEN